MFFFQHIGHIRNLAMEKVAATVQFPCRFAMHGCSESLFPPQKTEHETTCDFRSVELESHSTLLNFLVLIVVTK